MAMTSLDAFLSNLAASRFGYDSRAGEVDCMTAVGDWMKLATGKDPVAPYRGRYTTEIGAARVIRRAGGEAALLGSGAVAVGWKARPKGAERRGDVGVVRCKTPEGKEALVAAVCLAPMRWASMGPGGVHVGATVAQAAWGPANA